MTPSHRSKATELDAKGIEIHFSPKMIQAFRDLAAAVHFSGDFDGSMLRTVQDLAEGKPTSLHGVLVSLPAIAGETFRHIAATSDERAREAWDDISAQMGERGFTLSLTKVRERQQS